MSMRIECFFCGVTLTFQNAMYTRYGKTCCKNCISLDK
jgi:hypothetical protein